MRLFLMALPFWLWGLSFGATVAQDQAAEPQFIVIYDLPTDENREGHPMVNLRFVVRAENEYEAIIRSILYAKDFMPEHMCRRLKFREVAVRKPDAQK